MKLYHYVHCPFCLRVRFGLGKLNLPYESVVVTYDDETTPIKLTGKKMLPIVEFDDGTAMNESLDILKKVDTKKELHWEHYEQNQIKVDQLLNKISEPIYSLCMPYWIWTPEFSPSARNYFETKKSVKRGPFNQLVQRSDQTKKELLALLEENLLPQLEGYFLSRTITISDILIASHLWGLYIVPEFQFPSKIHHYLQEIKEDCHFNYHVDFWK